MATGDSNDILSRLKAVIPYRWFAYVAPIRDAVLGGLSDLAAWCYSWIVYATTQSRIATSTGPFLDLIAFDFLGRYLVRGGLSDNPFRARIMATILQERVTRAGMINALTLLTGQAPIIFEPWNTGDAGGYGCPNVAYGAAGGWGSMNLPGQAFVTVTRTSGSGVPNVGGYGSNLGGYGIGATEYVGPSNEQIGITDDDIYATIITTKPTGVICWTKIN
jgi:hypothetical protein